MVSWSLYWDAGRSQRQTSTSLSACEALPSRPHVSMILAAGVCERPDSTTLSDFTPLAACRPTVPWRVNKTTSPLAASAIGRFSSPSPCIGEWSVAETPLGPLFSRCLDARACSGAQPIVFLIYIIYTCRLGLPLSAQGRSGCPHRCCYEDFDDILELRDRGRVSRCPLLFQLSRLLFTSTPRSD